MLERCERAELVGSKTAIHPVRACGQTNKLAKKLACSVTISPTKLMNTKSQSINFVMMTQPIIYKVFVSLNAYN